MKNYLFILLFLVGISESLLAQTNGWYTAKQISRNTWTITEPGFHENMYLLEGEDSSLLIDAGFGMGNLPVFIKTLTSKPLIVVNTHSHPDHTGGDFQFPKVFVGMNDLQLAQPFLDSKVITQITGSMLPTMKISDSLKYPVDQKMNTQLVTVGDGRSFKLGKRNIKVINIPGHTPGSILLLDADHKMLFTGDNMATTWLFFKESLNVKTFLQSLENLKRFEGQFDRLYPGHGEPIAPSVFEELKACCRQILTGKCPVVAYHSMTGQDAVSCSYKSVMIAYDSAKVK
jgi:hydroxyacylglutathione hydrolase